MRYIVDTNVISEVLTGENNPDVRLWLARNDYYVPAPVIAELYDGVAREKSTAKRIRLRGLVDEFLGHCLTLDWDAQTAMVWADLWNSGATKSKPAPFYDSLLDVMGVRFNASIVSRNVSDFRHSTVFAPWIGLELRPARRPTETRLN